MQGGIGLRVALRFPGGIPPPIRMSIAETIYPEIEPRCPKEHPSLLPGGALMPRILIVDDEEAIRTGLAEILKEEGYECMVAADADQALKTLQEEVVDVVCTDVRMPRMGGIELLQRVKSESPEIEVIVITGFASVAAAVEAVKAGAHDYLSKPFDLDEVRLTVRRAIDKKRLTDKARRLGRKAQFLERSSGLIGSSPEFLKAVQLAERIAPTRTTVLILGETGTGKELFARDIHERSDRREQPFIPINCGALPDTLLESELFGHAKGAYTGADRANEGLFEAADGGTLFLDEIGNISLGMQSRLLRVLETGEFLRLGERKIRKVDVRIVAATNADLRKIVEQGKFRQDFFFRLNVMSITLPPLRMRRDDIARLAHHFLMQWREKLHKNFEGFSDAALKAMNAYAWPGNIRELENAIERAAILSVTSRMQLEDLPAEIAEQPVSKSSSDGPVSLSTLERDHILTVLKHCAGHRGRTAEVLGINRRTLYRKLIEYGFETESPGGEEGDDLTQDS